VSDTIKSGVYIPTTDVFDSFNLQNIDPSSREFKDFLTRLRQTINTMSIVINLKDTGYYITDEIANGQLYFPDPALNSTTTKLPVFRNVFRKVIDFGALPNTATQTAAHGITITSTFSFTRIYATATDPSTSFIPIPYASPTAANNIELSVDATNVSITTGSDRTGYTTTYVVLEWIVD